MNARRSVTLPLTLAGMLMLGACDRLVDVPAPPYPPQLVAQGFFSSVSPWAVRVSHSVGYGDAADPGFVDDATVEVWEGDRRLTRLARADTGTYVSRENLPAPGRTYTLHVSAPGFAAIEGHDVLPPPVPVSSFQEQMILQGDTATSLRRITRVHLTLDDPAGEANYYGLFVFQVRWQEDRAAGGVRWLPPSLFGFESDDPVLGDSPLAFLNTDKTFYLQAFFPDTDFDGQRHRLTFDVQYDAPHPDAAVITHRAFAVVFLSLTYDFFRYWKTAEQQATIGQNPFMEPLQVHSNLTGGLGVFAGFQVRFFPLAGTTPATLQAGLDRLCRLTGRRLPVCSTAAGLPMAGEILPASPALFSGTAYEPTPFRGSQQ